MLSLILFDAVVTDADLRQALPALGSLYRCDEKVCLEWRDGVGRTNRRHLGQISLRALAQPGSVPGIATLADVDRLVGQCIKGKLRVYGLETLLLDAQAWLFRELIGPLFAHAVNAAPLAALPRSALVRQHTGLALVEAARPHRNTAADPGFAIGLGAFVEGLGRDSSPALVLELVAICRRDRTLSNAADKVRMLRACLALAGAAREAGPISAMILAWAIDLIESGTRQRRKLKAITPVLYIRAAAMLLLNHLRGRSLERMSAAELAGIYRTMLEGLTVSRRRRLATALSSWHYYLTSWTEVEPLRVSLHKGIPLLQPRANIVWPHEVERIRTWLDTPGGDPRMALQLKAAFEIAHSVRIRISELLHLRMRDVRVEAGRIVIDIATRESDGGLKTVSARRQVQLTDGRGGQILSAWCDRRRAEGVLDNDYLYGDPYRPHRLDRPGELYLRLNRLLKAATGEAVMATHALSHTRISLDMLAVRTDSAIDINPYECVAAQSGHRSAATSLAHYTHMFEVNLRHALDRAVLGQDVVLRAIGSHGDVSPAAYRKAWSRQVARNPEASRQDFVLTQLERICPVLLCPPVDHGFDLVDPLPPKVGEERRPGLDDVLDLLHDMQERLPLERIALRSGRSQEWVRRVCEVALRQLTVIGEWAAADLEPYAGDCVAGLQAALSGGAGQRIQICRVRQPKLAALYTYLTRSTEQLEVAGGVTAWKHCYRRGYVALDQPGRADGFLTMLKAAEVPSATWRVCLASRDEAHPILALFHKHAVLLPAMSRVQARRGRPSAYLVIVSGSERAEGTPIPAAAACMCGIHALMLATAIRQSLELTTTTASTNSGETNG